MPLTLGTKLGPYEILAPIGVGGMGEVYLAKDTKLDREVAIKVLPWALAQNHDRLARFEREAKLLASLNHPNIAQIYGVDDSGGVRALVMELVRGETLSSLVKPGPLPLSTALNYAKQLAAALQAAHDKDIVHRDLKPANIMITPAGVVKVLDFGLAAVIQPNPTSNGDPHNSPTLTMTATQAGTIMGTAGYMSPEQAAGHPVDKRTDIWAFGVVLWEMLTGKPLFKGDTVSHILVAVLTEEPAWERVPLKSRRLLRSCLQRDINRRLRDIGDANLLFGEEDDGPTTGLKAPRESAWWKWIACATAIALIASLGALWRFTRPAERPLIRFDVELGTDLETRGRVAISPDGSRIAFLGRDENGKDYLLTRRLDQAKATVLVDGLGRGSHNFPFFSPDSKWIGYGGDHKLMKISVEGGLAVAVADGMVADGESSWGDNGDIVSGLTYAGLSRIPAAGGAAQLILPGPPCFPSFLPLGKSILISQGPLSILPFDGGKGKPIPGIAGRWARYLPIGYILYSDARAVLQALPFDATRLQAKGPPFPMLDDIESFDISSTGTFLGRRGRRLSRTVQWVDESGKTEPIIPSPGAYGYPQLSPDGKRLAVTIRDEKGTQIWIHDLERRATSRLTFGVSLGDNPQWMPGAKYLLFRGSDGIFLIPADGSGKPKRILETDCYPESISPDGRTLALSCEGQNTERDIWMVPLRGEGENLQAGKPEPFINGPADEINPSFSPDGKWLAYSSTETGTFAIYVRSLKNPGAIWQISTEEGFLPQWSPKGKEIIFHSLQGDRLRAVSYSVNADTFVPGVTRPFGGSVEFPPNGPLRTYTFSPTGKHIAAILAARMAEGVRSRPNYLLILNFFEEIKRHAAHAGAP
jgi:serine/threonine protein kinase/Tol biopolymer transport system component